MSAAWDEAWPDPPSPPAWDEAWPDPPSPPADLEPGATDEEQQQHAAALAVYRRSLRVVYVAGQIGGGAGRPFFPELNTDTTKASYREMLQADSAIYAVDEYAPAAPASMRTEAAIRMAGWLRDVDPAAASITHAASGDDGGSDAVTFRSSAGSALRNSGAMGLLSRYVVRRAGSIEPAPV